MHSWPLLGVLGGELELMSARSDEGESASMGNDVPTQLQSDVGVATGQRTEQTRIQTRDHRAGLSSNNDHTPGVHPKLIPWPHNDLGIGPIQLLLTGVLCRHQRSHICFWLCAAPPGGSPPGG